MKPILFDSRATTFTTNGIGRIEAQNCVVREELNGIYELEMTYSIDAEHADAVVTSNILAVRPYDGASIQAFRIYKVSKPRNGISTAYARHISYQLNWIPVMPFAFSSLNDCIAKLRTNSVYTNPFALVTNKSNILSGGTFEQPQSFRACLGGTQGSVLQRYGGDYEFDNWTVHLWTRRGSDRGVRIAYGKNLIDATQEQNIEETYTGVCPFYKSDDATVVLPEKYILASTASNFPFLRIKTVNFSQDFDGAPTVAQLRTHTQQYITANNIGHPTVSVDVSFVALWQTAEYADIAPLERVQLGDTVTVYFDRLGINEQARVVAYEYDVIKERYTRITIGDAKSSFSKTFVQQGQAIEAVADNVSGEISKSTSWLTRGKGYVVAVKNTDGSWKELLFLDTPDINTARKVLRINENGIGFSDNGYRGNYAQAWTLDGHLTLGGINNSYGTFQILDASGNVIGEWDKDGLSILRGIIEIDGASNGYITVRNAQKNRSVTMSDGQISLEGPDGFVIMQGDYIQVGQRGSNYTVLIGAGEITATGPSGEGVAIRGGEVSVSTLLTDKFIFNGKELDLSNGVTEKAFVDGQILYFENGLCTMIDDG